MDFLVYNEGREYLFCVTGIRIPLCCGHMAEVSLLRSLSLQDWTVG